MPESMVQPTYLPLRRMLWRPRGHLRSPKQQLPGFEFLR